MSLKKPGLGRPRAPFAPCARVCPNPLRPIGPPPSVGASSWRDYLIAAAWLQDVGESVSPVHHERHSYYMVKNGDFPGLDSWELEFIGQLVLWHKGGKIGREESPFKESARRGAFCRLLSLLRIVDAFGKTPGPLGDSPRGGTGTGAGRSY